MTNSSEGGVESTNSPPPLPPTFYTASEAAALLRLDESTVYRHLRAGTFPAVKIGGRYIVPRVAIDQLIGEVLSTGRCIELAAWMATRSFRTGQMEAK